MPVARVSLQQWRAFTATRCFVGHDVTFANLVATVQVTSTIEALLGAIAPAAPSRHLTVARARFSVTRGVPDESGALEATVFGVMMDSAVLVGHAATARLAARTRFVPRCHLAVNGARTNVAGPCLAAEAIGAFALAFIVPRGGHKNLAAA